MSITNNKFEKVVSENKVKNLLSIHKSYYEKIIRKILLKKKFINRRNIFIKNKFKLINLSDNEKKIITGHFPLKFRLKIFRKLITEKKLINTLKPEDHSFLIYFRG